MAVAIAPSELGCASEADGFSTLMWYDYGSNTHTLADDASQEDNPGRAASRRASTATAILKLRQRIVGG